MKQDLRRIRKIKHADVKGRNEPLRITVARRAPAEEPIPTMIREIAMTHNVGLKALHFGEQEIQKVIEKIYQNTVPRPKMI